MKLRICPNWNSMSEVLLRCGKEWLPWSPSFAFFFGFQNMKVGSICCVNRLCYLTKYLDVSENRLCTKSIQVSKSCTSSWTYYPINYMITISRHVPVMLVLYWQLALTKCSSYGLLYHLYPSLPTIQVSRSASPCRSPNFEPGGKHPILGVYTFLDMRKWVEAIQFLVFLPIFRENQESPHMTSSAFCVAALHQLHPAQHASYRSTSAILTLKRKTFEVSPIPLLCLKVCEAFSRFNPNCDNIFIGLVWGKRLTGNPCFTPRKKDQKRSKRWVSTVNLPPILGIYPVPEGSSNPTELPGPQAAAAQQIFGCASQKLEGSCRFPWVWVKIGCGMPQTAKMGLEWQSPGYLGLRFQCSQRSFGAKAMFSFSPR
jgi:hypothetical protein